MHFPDVVGGPKTPMMVDYSTPLTPLGKLRLTNIQFTDIIVANLKRLDITNQVPRVISS
jgi:hypothetical protein